MADGEPVLEDHLIDHQPEDLLLGLGRRVDGRVPDAGTKRLQALEQPEVLLTFRALATALVGPGRWRPWSPACRRRSCGSASVVAA